MIFFVVLRYMLRIVVLLLFCDIGGGFHWRRARAAAPAAASRLLSYCQNPGAPPPQPTGRGTNTRSLATETPNGSKPLTLIILLVSPESLPISRKQ